MAKFVDLKKTRYPLEFQKARTAFEKEFFTNVLRKFNGNVSATAEETNMSRRNLHVKISSLDIEVDRLRH